ncbi:sensor histidine kinase [Geomonas sp.]|uniref:sensor histidine kinase n=1 Tax=Geomonas sp. TaxID=2651584 RepID=UPI002B4A8255|nr:ATP-binding protein [Geomonas sp.]HJV34252.1 ATP-binding protein [Geomonas sp.]
MGPHPSETGSAGPKLLKHYEWFLAAGWTLAIILLFTLDVVSERQQTLETARTQARSNYQRDLLYHHWVGEHGGVYVAISGDTPPNPYLADYPSRDVTTTSGESLTLINPAYMTRLVFEASAKAFDIKGHITSMRPVRPENKPDQWEIAAFEAFARGEKEVSSVETLDGKSFMRLMTPLFTQRDCLACHAKDGYREGEIRGGISVAVPMAPLQEISQHKVAVSAASFSVLWAVGLVGLFTGGGRLRRAIRERDLAEQEVVSLNRDLLERSKGLEAANIELQAFNYSVSHDLRKPLTVINGYCQLIEELFGADLDESCRRYIGEIHQSTMDMNKLISTLLDFSRALNCELTVEAVDLSRLAQSVADELSKLDPTRQVSFSMMEGVTAACDPHLLRIVLDNLMGNSWKYCCWEHAVISFGMTEVEGAPVYFVRDNGRGFDMAQADKLFVPFQRLPGTTGDGHGIGLATVQNIIQRHGGRVWAEGEPGVGATFYFTLPEQQANR